MDRTLTTQFILWIGRRGIHLYRAPDAMRERAHLAVAANRERLTESIRRGEEQLASGEPLKTLDEIEDGLT